MSLFVMTGATSGIGLQAARLLLENPKHELIVGARDPEGAKDLRSTCQQDRLTIAQLDTSSLESVRTFASFVESRCSGRLITAIGLNAGMQPSNALRLTEDGVEECFAANYLGHYYLSRLLQPSMKDNGAIILTASGAHNKTDPIGKRLGYRGEKYSGAAKVALGEMRENASPAQNARDRYATSKFCLLLYAFAEPSWKGNAKVRLIAFDPGTVPGTQIVRDLGFIAKFAWGAVFPLITGMFAGSSTITRSGSALARLMVCPELAPQTGLHIDYRLENAKESPETHDSDLQNDLMTYSEIVCQKNVRNR